MNKSYSVGDLLSLYYENEFAAAEDAELPVFSAKHKRKMQRIFNLFQNNKARLDNSRMIFTAPSQLSFRKRLLFNVIIIVGLAFLAGCANALIAKNFPASIYSEIMNAFGYNVSSSQGYLHFAAQTGDKRVITSVIDDNNIEFIVPEKKSNTDGLNAAQTDIAEFTPICIEFRADRLSDSVSD